MADSGLDRAFTLPDVPDLGRTSADLTAALTIHFTALNDALTAMYNDVSARINEFLILQEWQSATPDLVVVDQDNYLLPDGIVIKISTDANRTFHGFAAPLVARFVVIFNNGSFNILLPHQSTNADLANRLSTSTGNTVTLIPDQSASFWYDLEISRWRQLML